MKRDFYKILTLLFGMIAVFDLSFAEDGDFGGNLLKLGTPVRKLEPDKMLTSGGVKSITAENLKIEPEFGVSHTVHQRELGMGYEDITHRVHAQAGGRLKLSEMFYLGFATKMPVYNYESTEGRTPGGSPTTTSSGRHEYEILRLSPNNLTMTGEMGIRLGPMIDLNMYYDQNNIKSSAQPGVLTDEQVIGTKFIFKFK